MAVVIIVVLVAILVVVFVVVELPQTSEDDLKSAGSASGIRKR